MRDSTALFYPPKGCILQPQGAKNGSAPRVETQDITSDSNESFRIYRGWLKYFAKSRIAAEDRLNAAIVAPWRIAEPLCFFKALMQDLAMH